MQQPLSTTVARAGLRLALHAGLSLVAMLASAGIGVAACATNVTTGGSEASSSGATTGEHCIGGIIDALGGCHAKCDPAKCLPGNTCVNNEGVLQCTTRNDCYSGHQSAAHA